MCRRRKVKVTESSTDYGNSYGGSEVTEVKREWVSEGVGGGPMWLGTPGNVEGPNVVLLWITVNRHKEWKQRKPSEWRRRTPTTATRSTDPTATWIKFPMSQSVWAEDLTQQKIVIGLLVVSFLWSGVITSNRCSSCRICHSLCYGSQLPPDILTHSFPHPIPWVSFPNRYFAIFVIWINHACWLVCHVVPFPPRGDIVGYYFLLTNCCVVASGLPKCLQIPTIIRWPTTITRIQSSPGSQ